MCSHYQAVKDRAKLEKKFGVANLPPPPWDLWPRYMGEFVRRPREWDSGDDAVPARELVPARWGLISAQTRAEGLAKAEKLSTFNARSETVARSFTFKHAWQNGQFCIIPADAVFEPDWRSGKAVPTRFTRGDGEPLGIAGIWDRYRDAAGQWRESYTMLTINADAHPLWRHYHRPTDERRSVVILPEGAYGDWLAAGPDEARDFLQPYPAELLVAEPSK
ncbi:Uncharacterised ACR%2C COG2135 [Bordetella ansorpii]|uniref:Abasic site processing protein n=1 Tax=Bordetella ansorpii TaxID=288768 RepID=A0A157RLI7_9BORD|nr:SOS response-associated peptidase family protein [Bordetella ansorpii]SAI58861.1 Uncharacterised ACR%2C COG2135 [Bordetella ansorpii]